MKKLIIILTALILLIVGILLLLHNNVFKDKIDKENIDKLNTYIDIGKEDINEDTNEIIRNDNVDIQDNNNRISNANKDNMEVNSTTNNNVIKRRRTESNDYEYIDNCIVTTEIYNKLKNNDSLYNISVLDYSKLKDISNKEAYNINRSLQEKIVKEIDKYHEYFAKTCGFKNKKELIKYIEAVVKLSNKEKK